MSRKLRPTMHRKRSAIRCTVTWAALAMLLSVAAGGCGEDPRPEVVAEVGGDVVSKAEFDEWARLRTGIGEQKAFSFDPPAYSACVNSLRRQAIAQSQPHSRANLKALCEGQLQTLMQNLIEGRWIRAEASRRHLAVDDDALKRSLKRQRAVAGSETLTEGSGDANEATKVLKLLKSTMRTEQLREKLKEVIVIKPSSLTRVEIMDYYAKHSRRFVIPARRRVRLLLAHDKHEARRARRALSSGRGWKSYVRTIRIDPYSRANQTGELTLAEDTGDDALLADVFATRARHIGGPVRTQYGWYVYKVLTATRARQKAVVAVSGDIAQTLREQKKHRARSAFIARYRRQTSCEEGYESSYCGVVLPR
jgi:foldase protein PrsA